MRVELLNEKIKEAGINKQTLAKQLDIDEATLYRKLKRNGESFTVKEVNKMIQTLQISNIEAANIFFNEKLA